MAWVAVRVPPRAVQYQIELGVVVVCDWALAPVAPPLCGAIRRFRMGSMRQRVEARVGVGKFVLLIEACDDVGQGEDVVVVDDSIVVWPLLSMPGNASVKDHVPASELVHLV
jgi:hypothetical protein